jgi:serine/threonine-protein kinase
LTEEHPSPVKEGDVLAGRYVVDRVLAVGGMGTVVAARHVQLGHKVALKFLHQTSKESGSAEKELVGRFLVEAKAAARLKSEHVVHVSDVGTLENGVPFMVMEFLEGCDLGDVLAREGPLPMELAVEYILQACEGLAEAHAARIVHRDLKPQNLFRTQRPDGSPLIKVLDFGVSKALADDVRDKGTVTSTDAVFGSPLYMSPEQMVSATRADQRSDIWSLGVVLYELLTGRLPFEAETMTGLCLAIANSPPRKLLQDAPDLPPELEAVIERCLEKDPNLRYANVAEFAADLAFFAPVHARAHVERIQRLVGSVPPGQPSVPSISKVTVPRSNPRPLQDAETLGPMTGSDLLPKIHPKKSHIVAIVAAGALVAGVGITVAIVLAFRNKPTEPVTGVTTQTNIAASSVAVAPAPSPPASTAPIPSATQIATAAVTSAIKKPTVAITAPRQATTAAPSASIILGISHDRK